MRRVFLTLISAVGLLLPVEGQANDYPTDAVADYVLGCMAANGQTATALRQCSCSIDVIASLLSFDDYTTAETILRMRQVQGGGERMAIFRETPFAKDAIDKLRRAQTEAEVRCFL
ncbi:hypothetical protein [Chelativorans xinjiangense]|uniref:hypothetical protein n=1 Tax=Chelativorans xinjiangense TaxID=2681485 RepID=UPI0013574892|nr:hypothetical protein [Chelativorans xinjiangense]